MKTFLRLGIALLIVPVLLSSCAKVTITPVNTNPAVGSWVLANAEQGDSYGWTPFSTGLENGVITLYSNGSAQYDDGSVSMQGSWSTTTVSGGYFDEYGSYYNGPHTQMQIHVSDYYTHSAVDLNFDYVSFYGSSFYGTYYNGQLIERYTFGRY